MSTVRAIARALVALLTLLRGVPGALARARHERPPAERADAQAHDPRRREVVSTPGRELAVAALLGGSAACSLAFAVLVLTGDPVQLEGVALGLAFALLAAALGLAASRVVPQVTAVSERPRLDHPDEVEAIERDLARGADGVSRRRLIAGAGIAATGTLAAALAVPAASLGPALGGRPSRTPWRRGRRLVDERGRPIRADEIAAGGYQTVFPAAADPRELGSPVVVVRVDPATLALPPGREGWAPEGLVAYSQICTHAACAVALYRSPLYEATAGEEPALECPCHYSVFAVRRGAKVLSGPAGRPLPQLPLTIASDRTLVAGGPLSGPAGPAWWGVRRR